MLWLLFFGGLFFAMYSLTGAFFVMLGFARDDDGEFRWHPEVPVFFFLMGCMLYGIYLWNPLG